jgi:hypothetical protein
VVTRLNLVPTLFHSLPPIFGGTKTSKKATHPFFPLNPQRFSLTVPWVRAETDLFATGFSSFHRKREREREERKSGKDKTVSRFEARGWGGFLGFVFFLFLLEKEEVTVGAWDSFLLSHHSL